MPPYCIDCTPMGIKGEMAKAENGQHRMVYVQSPRLVTPLRVALGLVFLIGGTKLAFPADATALAASYTNPETGWISPIFAAWITDTLGISIAGWLRLQGLIEIVLGLALVLGAYTSIVATIMGLMFWSFAVANPVVGEIRLSRDIALMGLCFAVAVAGAGAYSIDGDVRRVPSYFPERQDAFSLIIRLSLAYTLIASTLFTGGVFSNHLNSSLPVLAVFLAGLALAVGIFPRWVMTLLFVWMLYLIVGNLFGRGMLAGLDSVKREIGFLAASLVYVLSGRDVWAWPRRRFE